MTIHPPKIADLFANCPVPEPSTGIVYTGNDLETASEYRSETDVAEALAHEDALFLALQNGRVVLSGDGAPGVTQTLLHSKTKAEALGGDFAEAVLLGHTTDGGPRLVVHVEQDLDKLPSGLHHSDFRSAYIKGWFNRSDDGALAQGAALLAWNRSTKFCGVCGGTTIMQMGGYRRTCTNCGQRHFPRTDPVVISLAIDQSGDRCILGRSPHFPPGMVSCLAGFVDAGETLENAVRRETREESGIDIGRVRFHASQPWPAPHTIMIGFYGEATSDQVRFDSQELEACRWYSRDEILTMLEVPYGDEGREHLPPHGAIAHLLIRDWANGRLSP
ncbi:MAG: NAD(+) diphosphatase [Pseudomonadota bacterium]